MSEKLRKAIANNNDLYYAIFEQYQIKSENNGFIWYCLQETPQLYSNLVTTSKEWKPDEIFRQIDENYQKEKWKEWSIKDSFACLNLTEFGFDKLFDAIWIYLEPNNFKPSLEKSNLCYEIIKNEDLLVRWKLAWDENIELGNKIFTAELLSNKKNFFIVGYEENKVVSGCFVNQTEDVLGISNFFAPNQELVYWTDLVKFIFEINCKINIVGYERPNLTKQLREIGFEEIGNLRVWLKTQNV